MRRRAGLALGVAAALVPGVALGCPCGLVAGPSAPITGAADVWGASASLSYLREVAHFDEAGRVGATPAGVVHGRALLDVALGWRPLPRWELSLAHTLGLTHTAQRGVSETGAVLGDTTLRARWTLRDGFGPSWGPAVAVWGGVRLPTATGAQSDRALAAVSGLGLGAWEANLGAELRWTLHPRWQLALQGEGGLRTVAGLDAAFTPGPRVLAGVAGVFLPQPRVALSVGLSGWWEAAPSREGQGLPDGALQRTTCTAAITVQRGSHWRLGATVASELPWAGFGRNTPVLLRGGLMAVWTP